MNNYCQKCEYRYKDCFERITIFFEKENFFIERRVCDIQKSSINMEDLTELEKTCFNLAYQKYMNGQFKNIYGKQRQKITLNRKQKYQKQIYFDEISSMCPYKVELTICQLNKGDDIVE